MSCHVGVLPAELLQMLSSQISDTLENEKQSISTSLDFLKLPHPRTGIPSLFLPYELPQPGRSAVLEVQAVSPPNRRSWFLADEVVGDGKLLVMTPMDPAFILIRMLHTTQMLAGEGTFKPLDDIFEEVANKLSADTVDSASRILSRDVIRLSSLRCIQAAMRKVCEHKDITPEITVYRYSQTQAQQYLRAKVARLSGQHVSEISRTVTRNFAKDGLQEDGKEAVLNVGRLRAACDLVSQYLPKDVLEDLLSSYDFSLLDAHLKVLKEESMALAAANMNAVEARESKSSSEKEAGGDKKRKAAKASTGVEKLKKANIKGMAKLSTFFVKK